MVAPEHFQRFARRTHASLFQVFQSLTDAFLFIGLRCDIQKSLIGFGILHDCFGLSIDGEYEWFFRLFEMLHELRRIAAKICHGLDVFFISNMKASRSYGSTFKGAIEEQPTVCGKAK